MQEIQIGQRDGIAAEDSIEQLAKTWFKSRWTEQGSQDEKNKTGVLLILAQTKSSDNNMPGAMSILPENRLPFEYKDLMITFKDNNGRLENHEEALKDPNFDEYHSIKGRQEDDVHKPETLENRTHLRINHEANTTLSDRQNQVATAQHGNPSSSVFGRGS